MILPVRSSMELPITLDEAIEKSKQGGHICVKNATLICFFRHTLYGKWKYFYTNVLNPCTFDGLQGPTYSVHELRRYAEGKGAKVFFAETFKDVLDLLLQECVHD